MITMFLAILCTTILISATSRKGEDNKKNKIRGKTLNTHYITHALICSKRQDHSIIYTRAR